MGRPVSEQWKVAEAVMDWLLLHECGPMSAKEIAEATGLENRLVHDTLTRAVRKVRRKLVATRAVEEWLGR